ncbi:hypothetical protein Dsin_013000 [Dipteronia sinensis]|uniref:DNA-directed DNA polymerase family A palm domain-containing protein n=1 Tax=Dipteronia sinensis TaxID=43782 RepID=A0AAE0AJZ6_9ROSI|nr:hypothetical protein Dsin_013000 [Dipteronia sinensis]
MLMGISSTAIKGPFFPWPSSVSPSSSRFLSSASFKALKRTYRREIHTIQNFRGTNFNITILSRIPCSNRSAYHTETSPTEDASTQMTSSYLDLNSLKRKPWPDFDFRSHRGSRNHSGPPVLETGHNNPCKHNGIRNAALAIAATPSIPSTLDRWDREREIVQMMRGKISLYRKNESLQDGSSYNEVVSRKQRWLQNSKPPSGAETKDICFGNEVVDYMNGDSKKNNLSPNHFAKEPNAKLSRKTLEPKSIQMMKGEISLYQKNESLQDGSSYNKEVVSCKQRLLQNSKPPGHSSFVPSGTEPKDIGFGNEAVDYVNGDSKKNNSSQNHFAMEPNAKLSRKTPNSWKKKNPKQSNDRAKKKGETKKSGQVDAETLENFRKRLSSIYHKVRVVDNIAAAKEVVRKLTGQYRHWVHACDTEVAKIDVKHGTPIDHGEVICFSIYSGTEADFGDGKSCIWVDVLDGGGSALLNEFAPFFEDPAIKKVWHNYSFDNHVIENYGIKLSGFHADTMHMARLWNSSRRKEGYSLEALTVDPEVMSGAELEHEKDLIGKISMKKIFSRKKLKKDGSEGKNSMTPAVEELQREERRLWICYSALDAISTLKLHESLEKKLLAKSCKPDKKPLQEKSMLDFYREYWLKFGEILVKIETAGMLVDRPYLAKIEKVAKAEREVAVNTFRNWASKYCPDAKYMNVGSGTQLRHLLFGSTKYSKVGDVRIFKVLNTKGVIEEGKKTPTKFRKIKLHPVGITFPIEICTDSGQPSVRGDTLKRLVAKISAQYDFTDETADLLTEDDADNVAMTYVDEADSEMKFHTLQERREAFHAIASLCKVCSIDSLISNFILPLQGSKIVGKDGRVHCSLNINTETGRLSSRRPNLQNQPALEKDRYKIRQAFIAAPGHSLIVADYGQLELRILAHLANCKSMLDAFKAGGDFHSRTAMNMYPHIREAVEMEQVLLEWHPQPGETKPSVPLLKDAFASERRKAKMLNFSIAYGKTPLGLAQDWKVSVEEAKSTIDLWYKDRQEVLRWQEARKREARELLEVHTLLGRARRFPSFSSQIERAAINTPVQGSAADVAMCAMLEISTNARLKELGWILLLQVHDEVILEGPSESAEVAKAIVVECMSKPFNGKNILSVDLNVDAKCAQNWYVAK